MTGGTEFQEAAEAPRKREEIKESPEKQAEVKEATEQAIRTTAAVETPLELIEQGDIKAVEDAENLEAAFVEAESAKEEVSATQITLPKEDPDEIKDPADEVSATPITIQKEDPDGIKDPNEAASTITDPTLEGPVEEEKITVEANQKAAGEVRSVAAEVSAIPAITLEGAAEEGRVTIERAAAVGEDGRPDLNNGVDQVQVVDLPAEISEKTVITAPEGRESTDPVAVVDFGDDTVEREAVVDFGDDTVDGTREAQPIPGGGIDNPDLIQGVDDGFVAAVDPSVARVGNDCDADCGGLRDMESLNSNDTVNDGFISSDLENKPNKDGDDPDIAPVEPNQMCV